jgi:hypothetical protein
VVIEVVLFSVGEITVEVDDALAFPRRRSPDWRRCGNDDQRSGWCHGDQHMSLDRRPAHPGAVLMGTLGEMILQVVAFSGLAWFILQFTG